MLKEPRCVADVTFPGRWIDTSTDRNLWHRFRIHGSCPNRSEGIWQRQIEANRLRNADTNARLQAAGWAAQKFSLHKSAVGATAKIARAVAKTDAHEGNR